MSVTYMPFLYQTRTILQCRRPAAALRPLHQLTARRKAKSSDDIPFAQDMPGEYVTIEKEPELEPKGTITPNEREAFDKIFADIAARGLKPNMQQHLPPPSPNTRRTTNIILEQATYSSGQQRPGAVLSPVLQADAAKDKDKAIMRFPPQLRAAARRAFEFLKADQPSALMPRDGKTRAAETGAGVDMTEWAGSNNTLKRLVELDAKRYPERKRVQDLMFSATTDFELWDVMEKEVFTYPARLGLASLGSRQQNTPREKSKKGQGSKRELSSKSNAVQATNAEAEAETLSTPDGATTAQNLDFYIFGPLYPLFLLLGLRRLDTAFSAPSPLALSILPRVKELGLESFVLGVSTAFYNELLAIYYRRYGDISKLLDLLEEMRHSGLYFDEAILDTVETAYRDFQALGRGEGGTFARAFMTMPEHELSVREHLRHWRSAIEASIAQKEEDIDHEQIQESSHIVLSSA